MRTKTFNYSTFIFLASYHLLLIIGLPLYFYWKGAPSLSLCLWSLAILACSNLSITAGYHRLFAHKTYQASLPVRLVLLFFGTLSLQESVIRWSFEHRIHHAKVDTKDDPYSITKGFWYAHVLWLFDSPMKINKKTVSDLYQDPWLKYQHEHYVALTTIFQVLVLAFLTSVCQDFWGALIIGTLLRWFLCHHSTWFINSLAHWWGSKSYCKELSAVDNYLLSLVTFGEGYHNYHHSFPNDYRNGIAWYHFDPTKWLIFTLDKLGLASKLKRNSLLSIRKRQILKDQHLLIEKIRSSVYLKKDYLEQKIEHSSQKLLEELSKLHATMKAYKEAKKAAPSNAAYLKDLKKQLKELDYRFKQDWKQWTKLSSQILNLQLALPA